MVLVRANGWAFDCEFVGDRESAGDGPDLVFIHGEIHGRDYWHHQLAEFARNHRCLVYNRRGHAGTGAPDYGYSPENQRRDLEALIAHFGIREPVLVALAFGSTIAADYAIRHPEAVRGIVMVAWSELHDARAYLDRWARASAAVVGAFESGGREAVYDLLRREGGRTIYMVIPPHEPMREKCVQLMGRHPIDEYRRGMLEFATSVPDLVAPFARLDVPVLGVCGGADPFPDRPELLAGMKTFREAPTIDGACRFVQWERPTDFIALLRDFLASLS